MGTEKSQINHQAFPSMREGEKVVILLRGLPGAGKSTLAEEIVAKNRALRVNRDLVREMLHFYSSFTRPEEEGQLLEGITSEIVEQAAVFALTYGYSVVVDETNLKDINLQYWKMIADRHKAKFELIDLEVDIETCIQRDALRPKRGQGDKIYSYQVGEGVIRRMASRRKK